MFANLEKFPDISFTSVFWGCDGRPIPAHWAVFAFAGAFVPFFVVVEKPAAFGKEGFGPASFEIKFLPVAVFG